MHRFISLAIALALLPTAAVAQATDDVIESAIDDELAAVRTHLDDLAPLWMTRDDVQAKVTTACMRALTAASQDFAAKLEEGDVTLGAELAERRKEHRDFDACLKRADIPVRHAPPKAK